MSPSDAASILNGRFRFLAELGRGSSARVSRALDLGTGNEVAIKKFSRDYDRELAADEFAKLCGLSFPGLCRGEDCGLDTADGGFFFVSELVRGEDLVSGTEGLESHALVQLTAHILRALAFVHERQLIHRDLKPENMLLDGSLPQSAWDSICPVTILDFGLASEISAKVQAAGTLRYLPPEVLQGGDQDPRSDLFSLGAVLFEVLTRRPAFEGQGSAELRREQLMTDRGPRAEMLSRGEPLPRLIASLLEPNPERRPPSARAALMELARLSSSGISMETEETRIGRLLSSGPPREDLPSHGELAEGGSFVLEWGMARELQVTLSVLRGRASRAGLAPMTLRLGAAHDDAVALVVEGIETFVGAPRGTVARAASYDQEKLGAALAMLGRHRGLLILEGVDPQTADEIHSQAKSRSVPLVLIAATPGERAGLDLLAEAEPRRSRPRILHADQLEEWLRDVLGDNPSRELVDALAVEGWTPAEGFLREALAEALRRGAVRFGKSGVRLLDAGLSFQANQDLAALYGERLESLDDAELEVLELAAIARGARTAEDLGNVVQGSPQPELFEAMVHRGWLRRRWRDQVAFYELGDFSLIEALLARLDEEKRREAHSRWAEVSTGGDRGLHLAMAARPEEAIPYLSEAAEKHLAEFRLDDAFTMLRSLESCCRHVSELRCWRECHRLLGRAYEMAGDYAKAVEHLEQARSYGVGEEKPDLDIAMAKCLARSARRDEALQVIEGVLAIEGLDATRRAEALLSQAVIFYQECRFDDARRLTHEAMKDLPQETVAGLRALNSLILIEQDAGDYEEAARIMSERALPVASRLGPSVEASTLVNAARTDRARGLIREALTKLDRASALFSDEGEKWYLAQVGCNQAEYRLIQGDVRGAKWTLQRVREELDALGDRGLMAQHALLSALVAYLEGDRELCERLFEESRTTFEGIDDRLGMAEVALHRCRVTAVRGDRDGSRASLGTAERIIRSANLRSLEPDLALAHAEWSLRFEPDKDWRDAWRGAKSLEPLTPISQARRSIRFCRWAYRAGDFEEAHRFAREGQSLVASMDVEPLEAVLACWEGLSQARIEREWSPRGFEARLELLGDSSYRENALHLNVESVRLALDLRDGKGPLEASWVRDRLEQARQHAATLGDESALALCDSWRSEVEKAVVESMGGEEAQRRLVYLERLRDVTKAINDESEDRKLLDFVVEKGLEFAEARRGFLLMVKHNGFDIQSARHFGESYEDTLESLENPEFAISHTVARHVAESGRPLLIANAAEDPQWRSSLSISHLKLLSIICVPLKNSQRVIGALYLDDPTAVDRFDTWHLEMLADFTEHAAIAIEKARLLRENIEKAKTVAKSKREIERLNLELMKQVDLQARELVEVKKTLQQTQQRLAIRYDYSSIIAQSPKMRSLLRELDRVTESRSPVVIHGESGTGKELVARVLHANSQRRDHDLLTINCAALPDALVESELFGYRRGAFTGATQDRAGIFELADKGTLFLDEIGDMSLDVQKRFLRVLQFGEFYRLGDKAPCHVDVRVIAATHRDLADLVKKGEFREDLFYRLNVLRVTLPPLRERSDDIPLLVDHFLKVQAEADELSPARLTRRAMDAMVRYPWPGNIRELENEVRNLLVLFDGEETIDLTHLPERIREAPMRTDDEDEDASIPLKAQVERFERDAIRRALEKTGGNKTAAANLLGMSTRNLHKKMSRLEMS